MNFRENAVVWLATGFNIGNLPLAPGTFGSLLGLPLCFALTYVQFPLAIFSVLLFIIVAVGIANGAEKILKQKDPSCIVIDEVAGMLVTLFGVPFNFKTAVLGFIVFRILDISKPFPIRALEKKIPGGAGVVVDDLVAGIFGNVIIRFAFYI